MSPMGLLTVAPENTCADGGKLNYIKHHTVRLAHNAVQGFQSSDVIGISSPCLKPGQYSVARQSVASLTSMNTGMQNRMSHLSATQLDRKLAGVGMTGGSAGLYNAKVAPLVSYVDMFKLLVRVEKRDTNRPLSSTEQTQIP